MADLGNNISTSSFFFSSALNNFYTHSKKKVYKINVG